MSYIYQTVQECDFHDAFIRMDRKENFSYEARAALYEHLIEIAEADEPIELDVIALCCEWSEADADEIRELYDGTEECETSDDIEAWLSDETIVIRIGPDNFLYQVF